MTDAPSSTKDMRPKYGGQTSCGYPYCAPDPELVRKLEAAEELLAALDTLARLHYGDRWLEGPAEGHEGTSSQTFRKARAAHAKARGQ